MSQTQEQAGGYAWYVVLLCMVAYIFSFCRSTNISAFDRAHSRRFTN